MSCLQDANEIADSVSTAARGLRKTAAKVTDDALRTLHKLTSESSSSVAGPEKEQLEDLMHGLVKSGGAVDRQCRAVESPCYEISRATLRLRGKVDPVRLTSQLRSVRSLAQALPEPLASFQQQVSAAQRATERWAARSDGSLGTGAVAGGALSAGILTGFTTRSVWIASAVLVSMAVAGGLWARGAEAASTLDALEESLRQLHSVLQASQSELSQCGDTISEGAGAAGTLLERLETV